MPGLTPFSHATVEPIMSVVLVDSIQLASAVEIMLAPTMLRLLAVDAVGAPPVNLLSEYEGISWCRGWDGDAARALFAYVALR